MSNEPRDESPTSGVYRIGAHEQERGPRSRALRELWMDLDRRVSELTMDLERSLSELRVQAADPFAKMRADAERYRKLRNTHMRPNDPMRRGQIAITGFSLEGRIVMLRGKNADELIDRLPAPSEPRD